MPMGVPVVLPSNTPERMRTASGSLRWLTKCEVPVRRRFTSPCRSLSDSSSPGGQPSTMQPSAGPWLSPKVVTVKSLPIELPDIQLFRRQQKYSAAAAFEFEPREGQLRERAAYRVFGVADLHDQHSTGPQMAARFAQDHPHGVETRATRGKRQPRLVAIFGWQTPHFPRTHIRRITHDDI